MKIKKINTVKDDDFNNIYNKKPNTKKDDWEKEFSDIIEHYNHFTFSNSFWYIGDFSTSKIVAVGGDCETVTPLLKKEWLGLEPMEIGKMFHPLDVMKMQAFTVFVSNFLAPKTQKQRDRIKISMLFRMLDTKKNYTWRLMQYPKISYEKQLPRYIFCQISDIAHLLNQPKCTMYILDNNKKENTLYYCDDEKIELKPVHVQKNLSERELDVLRLLSKGLISKEIAEVLKISKNTVENHKQNIFSKTTTKNLAELITYAHKNIFETK